jgi:tripeptide aminopeptidase
MPGPDAGAKILARPAAGSFLGRPARKITGHRLFLFGHSRYLLGPEYGVQLIYNRLRMSHAEYAPTVADRFLRYVQIDTQSDPHSTSSPSSEKQKDLSRLLVDELRALGVRDAHLDAYGYVYATLPATTTKSVPVLCFCAHVDTSPDVTGANVRPLVHDAYDGRDLVLPDDPSQVIRLADHPDLADQRGHTLITASGTTLLGADNKAGVAAIMEAAAYLLAHPELERGAVKILFTPDEEIGRGTAHVDLEKLGADYGYTIDGETRGSIEDETFSADAAQVILYGVSAHPGFAKGRLLSALKLAAELLAGLPTDRLSPETTEGGEGFIHPVELSGTVERAEITFILRDFTEAGLRAHEAYLRTALDGLLARYPAARGELHVTEQYRNLREVLDQHPQVVEYALEALRRAGLTPKRQRIRGGTDGSRLSFMGLPCPNLFAGEHAFHSRQEWVSVEDMQAAAAVIVQLCRVWTEPS